MQKMFMGREFVVKHIRNKHGHVLEAERERLQEEAFWENFRWGGWEQQAVAVVCQLSVLGELQVGARPCLLGWLVWRG